jgi:hypothetical protein
MADQAEGNLGAHGRLVDEHGWFTEAGSRPAC